ncbi:hypothetical protein C8R43DRAFT_1142287 [Mycena crocata]|nr:hypothetical protein C8R43DRAFT_1142287 [Mycena crocata]
MAPRGRPPGTKDGPRAPGAPKRGRPIKAPAQLDDDDDEQHETHTRRKHPGSASERGNKRRRLLAQNQANPRTIASSGGSIPADSSGASSSQINTSIADVTLLDEFENYQDDWGPGDFDEMDRIEREAFGADDRPERTSASLPEVRRYQPTAEELSQASKHSRSHLFFSKREGFDYETDSEEEETESQNEDDEPPKSTSSSGQKNFWFPRPKRMAEWEYNYICTTVGPIILKMDGRSRAKPPIFDGPNPTLCVQPPDPLLSLLAHRSDPTVLFRRPIRLWLPHFWVDKLLCPRCREVLEKNGAITPRRITDIEEDWYLVTWSYYCRNKSCKSYYHGWSSKLLSSLPPYVQLAFPAVLSRKGGLSRRVLTLLRGANQHKMGPTGVRSLLLEMHTLRFNTLQLQYLESIFELEYGRQSGEAGQVQTTLHAFDSTRFPSFGDFGTPDKFNGSIPSVPYLTLMMNKAIELEEGDANQHTACQRPDTLAVDDSHKINKHMAKVNGVPIFGALWTCMTSHYIRAQALTLTKAHEERLGPLMGIAASAKKYGYSDPTVVYSDDPVKDKSMLYAAFPSLSEKLTPIAAAHGLESLTLPLDASVIVLGTPSLVETTLSALTSSLDVDLTANLCVSLDAEWNVSRHIGVSILQLAPHGNLKSVYIIPVHRFTKLPPALLRILTSPRIFLVGSAIKGDFTRLKKQFPQLSDHVPNLIDLKQFAAKRGVIKKNEGGSLEKLAEKVLHKYLPKDPENRKSEAWETNPLPPNLQEYAALDVFTSRLLFEKMKELAPIDLVQRDTAAGTRVALLVHEGGDIAAYGTISATQLPSLSGVRNSRTRLIVDIHSVVLPSAAVILHLDSSSSGQTKSGALTLSQLQARFGASVFPVVSPLKLLEFDRRIESEPEPIGESRTVQDSSMAAVIPSASLELNIDYLASGDESDAEDEPFPADIEEEDSETAQRQMLEAHAQANSDPKGKKRAAPDEVNTEDEFDSSPLGVGLYEILRKLVENPTDVDAVYTRIKKDIFHAFHMITLSPHGLRAAFFRTLRDHIMRWDPTSRQIVDKACRRIFNVTFEVMLIRDPRWIQERVPRYVPSPSVLVPAIKHVYNVFGNALDAETGRPLFNKQSWEKANAVLELAREGYLSDIEGVAIYERAGVDEYGLQKWICDRGTNKLEGGPHGDIYRKFGALNAGPRLTVNSLTDHRTRYNLQAYAKHQFGVNWDYHYTLSRINRTSFLLNYLSDVIDGAVSYSHWMNTDLYERTNETFGVCTIPESLRLRLDMQPYTTEASAKFKLNPNDDWLRQRQGLALPILPPTTPDARTYFFTEIRHQAEAASKAGKKKVDFEQFAKKWNRTADGKARYYVTTEVLRTYSKTWEKISNIRASQDLIAAKMDLARQTGELFSASTLPFPESLKGNPTFEYPQHGVLTMEDDLSNIPESISVGLAISHPRIHPIQVVSQKSVASAATPNTAQPRAAPSVQTDTASSSHPIDSNPGTSSLNDGQHGSRFEENLSMEPSLPPDMDADVDTSNNFDHAQNPTAV